MPLDPRTYDPSFLFAPAHIPGNEDSKHALRMWYLDRLTPMQKANPLTVPYTNMGTKEYSRTGADDYGLGGENLKGPFQFGMKGFVPSDYLQATAWNSPYDYEGAKNRIALQAALQAAQQAQAQPAPQPFNRFRIAQ